MKQRIRESVSQGESRPTPPQGESKSAPPQGENQSVCSVTRQQGNLDDLKSVQEVYDELSSTREALWEQARERPELYKVLYSTHAAWFTRTLTYLHIHREMIYHKWNIEETCDRFPGVDRGIIELIRDCPRPEWLGTIGVEPDIQAQAYLFVGLLKRRLDTPYPGEENSNTGPILHDLARSINEAFLAEFDYEKAYEWSELMWRMLSGQKMLDGDDIMGEIFSVLGIDATLLKADKLTPRSPFDLRVSRLLKDIYTKKAEYSKKKAIIARFIAEQKQKLAELKERGELRELEERKELEDFEREIMSAANSTDSSSEEEDVSTNDELPNGGGEQKTQDGSDSSEPQDDGDTNNGGILDSLFGLFGNEAPPVLSDPR